MSDEQLIQLAHKTAAELELSCTTAALSHANERDHLHPACKRAAQRLAPRWNPAASLGPYAFGDTLGWVGLGNVDLVFSRPDRLPTFLELKCGAGKNTLSACVWDAVKLAAGLLADNAGAGYLLAGAPHAHWQRPILGAELFDSRAWRTNGSDVRDAYLKWWLHWQNEPKPHVPGRVAAVFRTSALGSFPLEIAGTAWELRLARVEPDAGAGWLDWQPI